MDQDALTDRQSAIVRWLESQESKRVSATPERLQQFKTELLEKLGELEVRVPDQASDATTLLYSGRVGSHNAWELAEAIGTASNGQVVTIGQTELGALQNADEFKDALRQTIGRAKGDTYHHIEGTLWDRASERLAQGAKGDVRTLTQTALDNKVFASVELPEILRNPNVSHLNGVPLDRYQHIYSQTPGSTAEKLSEVNKAVQHTSFERTRDMRLSVSYESVQQGDRTVLRAAPQTVDPGKLFDGTPYTQPPRLTDAQTDVHMSSSPGQGVDNVGAQGDLQSRRLQDGARHLDTAERSLHVRSGAAHHGARTFTHTVKGAGIAGTVYGAYDAKGQIDAAIDTARSNREQWVRGSEEAANQGTKAVVTGAAATVGAIPGAAAGALTSPVTGPVGPVVGGLATGGVAAVGAEKLYEDSRLQQWSKALGREVGELGYDHVSREGRLLGQVNGLKQDLQTATDPAERARLQTRLTETSEQFSTEAERNGRYFEARAGIDKAWEQTHAKYPKVDKDDVTDALAKHIDAGKRPADAARGALSDAVHERYPRALPHQPVENYRAMSNEQLTAKHGQYVGEVAQGRQDVLALAANKDSHNNVDQGWPKALAQERQAGRVRDGLNELWRDTGHLGAVRESMHERGLKLPELPAELRPQETKPSTSPRDAFRQQENLDRGREPTGPGRSPGSVPRAELSPQQERHHQLAHAQLGPGLSARGHSPEQIEQVSAAAVGHAQTYAHRGTVRAFHLSKDGERVAVVQESAPISEFSVKAAQSQPADQHLERAHAVAQTQAREQTPAQAQQASTSAPQHEAPQRAMA